MAATAIWTVRTVRGPRSTAGPVRSAAQGVRALDVSAVLALAVAASGLLVLSILHSSEPVPFERSIEYTGLVFLIPTVAWRVLRMVRPGPTALDNLATAAPAVTGGALLVAAVAYGALYSTPAGFIATGLLALAGSLLRSAD